MDGRVIGAGQEDSKAAFVLYIVGTYTTFLRALKSPANSF